MPAAPAMDGRQRRLRHWRASLGSMLNENYDDALTPASVVGGDFVYVPKMPLPLSRNALKFLEHKFPGNPPPQPRPSATGSVHHSLQRALTQPQMMVHYDRDPLYRDGPNKPVTDAPEPDYNKEIRQMSAYAMNLVPQNVAPASTPDSVSTAPSPPIATRESLRGSIEITGEHLPSSKSGSAAVNIEHNRHRLWSPDSEAAGFKPYTPFSDTQFDKQEAKFFPPELDEVKNEMEVPRYYDAYRQVMNLHTQERHTGSADVLRVHGNPDYPNKMMAETDVPNYVAWAKIYPYCPLSQVKGQAKPVYVPPRGFTPSTAASKSKYPAQVNDVDKFKREAKRDVMEGVAQAAQPFTQTTDLKPADKIAQKTKRDIMDGIKPPMTPGLSGKQLNGQGQLSRGFSSREARTRLSQHTLGRSATSSRKPFRRSNSMTSLESPFEPNVPRRILDMKAPDVWYTGQTPTRTPTPDYTLPVKPTRDWVKHFSPQRVRHFLNIAAADCAAKVF